jgi:hypothetical protein
MAAERSCLLVAMRADSFGNKESLAVSDGYRESAQSWKEILLDLRSRGLEKAPAREEALKAFALVVESFGTIGFPNARGWQ